MTERGFITPPPGLLPEPPKSDTSAPAEPRLAPPAFFPAPPGAAPVGVQQETAAQPVVAPPSVAPSTDPEPVVPVPAAVVPAPAVAPETATPVPDEPEAAPGDWTLEIDGADFGSIPDVLVLGRAPNAAVPGARLLPVSGGGTVSATHAVLRRDGDAVTLEDLGSTNGTAVVVGDGRELLPPHQAVRITETVDVWLAHARLRLRRS